MNISRPKPNDPSTKRLANKLARLAAKGHGEKTTGWEKTFLTEVKTRVEHFGSAFCDEEKGDLGHHLSIRQYYKMQEISRLIRYRDKKLNKRK